MPSARGVGRACDSRASAQGRVLHRRLLLAFRSLRHEPDFAPVSDAESRGWLVRSARRRERKIPQRGSPGDRRRLAESPGEGMSAERRPDHRELAQVAPVGTYMRTAWRGCRIVRSSLRSSTSTRPSSTRSSCTAWMSAPATRIPFLQRLHGHTAADVAEPDDRERSFRVHHAKAARRGSASSDPMVATSMLMISCSRIGSGRASPVPAGSFNAARH
jgi:hypothetical protein